MYVIVKVWLLLSLVFLCFGEERRDPYQVLGVSRRSAQNDIKKAYKALAKEWHPDKTDDPKAQAKFIEINQAYEILSDPEKRERYDRFGEYADSPRGNRRGEDDEFEGGFPFANFGNFNFRYSSQSSFFAKHRISLRAYEQSLIQKSFSKPFIIFAYADWCMPCHQAEPIWEKIVEGLEPIGYGIATVNAMLDGTLLNRLRVQRLPAVVVLFEGRSIHYRQNLNQKSVVQFARDVLPPNLIKKIEERELTTFLESWKLNQVSVLIFGNTDKPRLRYVLAAIKYQNFARFGYVRLGYSDAKMREALNVKATAGETVLIFNEKPEQGPVASLTAKDINADSLDSLIDSNKYLILPRVSSQSHFDDLCPPSLLATNKKLCAILVVRDGGEAEAMHVRALRDMVELRSDGRYSKDQLRFLYMFAAKQRSFLDALQETSNPTKESDSHRDIVVVWRREKEQARYEWLRRIWNGSPTLVNASSEKVLEKLDGFLRGKAVLSREAVLAELTDEYGPNLYTQFARSVMRLWETLIFHITKEEFLPAVSVAGTLAVIMGIGYCLNYAVSMEEKAERKRKMAEAAWKAQQNLRKNPASNDPTAPMSPEELKMRKKEESVLSIMRELRAETYFGMIRLLKPGWRTIVVLVDDESKEKLTREFARAMWPWRNNKTLMFGYMVVPKNLQWFRKILEYTLPTEEEEEEESSAARFKRNSKLKLINPKQVVGTVLALNGWRLYFCMYHPKYEPSMKGYRGPGIRNRAEPGTGFLGVEDNEDADSSDEDVQMEREQLELIRKKKILGVHELLAALPNWLDRLFEGSLRRYYIPEWPEPK